MTTTTINTTAIAQILNLGKGGHWFWQRYATEQEAQYNQIERLIWFFFVNRARFLKKAPRKNSIGPFFTEIIFKNSYFGVSIIFKQT